MTTTTKIRADQVQDYIVLDYIYSHSTFKVTPQDPWVRRVQQHIQEKSPTTTITRRECARLINSIVQ